MRQNKQLAAKSCMRIQRNVRVAAYSVHRLPTRNKRPVLSSDSAVRVSDSSVGKRNTKVSCVYIPKADNSETVNCGNTMLQLCRPIIVPASARKSVALTVPCNEFDCAVGSCPTGRIGTASKPRESRWGSDENRRMPKRAYGTHSVIDH